MPLDPCRVTLDTNNYYRQLDEAERNAVSNKQIIEDAWATVPENIAQYPKLDDVHLAYLEHDNFNESQRLLLNPDSSLKQFNNLLSFYRDAALSIEVELLGGVFEYELELVK